ncbi:MAG: calcium-translocating P-type ATPase, SERCA-type [Anaerolineae bacterium]|nr:calcium-translocating P-type ATPase, SERCA-type [Anaerolineae bacterium]
MPATEVADALRTHYQNGLSSAEAAARLQTYGPNELQTAPRPGFLSRLWEQFNNFLMLMLVAASIISLLLGDVIEAGAIMAIVLLNAILGIIQESRAEEALAALKKMSAPEAHVIRDGRQTTIPAREVVPGDIVLLETGNYVPADLRLIEAVNLRIDESALTGESVPVSKRADVTLDRDIPLGDRSNTAFTSTVVTYGRGRGIVVDTGMRTQIGLIARMLQSTRNEPTPLQVKLEQLGRTLGWGALAICALVFGIGWLRGGDPLEMFIVAVSLAIAAVPEGLPAVVTISLALGMQRMIRRHALIRSLPAVEALGSTTVICSDKTGTLTQNEMTVVRLYADEMLVTVTGEGYTPEGKFLHEGREINPRDYPAIQLLLRGAALCNDAYLETSGTQDGHRVYRMIGDPTEGALVVAAAKAGLWKPTMEEETPRVGEIPFESERKRMTTIHEVELHDEMARVFPSLAGDHREATTYIAFVKGAPDLVLDQCTRWYHEGQEVPLTDADRERFLQVNREMASDALRMLAVAYRELDEVPDEPDAQAVERDLTFIGLVGMIDPARPEVKPAIETARRAGIKTVMITGDYPETAVTIAREIGLLRPNGRVVTGTELDQLSDETLVNVVDEIDVYARTSPQHKVRIVDALKARNHITAMTGDGVNDAPALKRADIGIAMGITGTDVAKETADMVLTDDNYASIVAAVEEGRVIYSNIHKFVYYLLSCNVGEILIIFIATLAGLPLPLTAIQLLWLNLLTDGAPALALGLEKGDPDIMEQPPRPPDEPVINRDMVIGIVVQSLAIMTATLGAFLLGNPFNPATLDIAESMAFTTLTLSELLRAYTTRSERYPLYRIGIFSNKYMQYAVLASLALLLLVLYVPFLNPIFNTWPLSVKQWLEILPLIFLPAATAEITKLILYRRRAHPA